MTATAMDVMGAAAEVHISVKELMRGVGVKFPSVRVIRYKVDRWSSKEGALIIECHGSGQELAKVISFLSNRELVGVTMKVRLSKVHLKVVNKSVIIGSQWEVVT